MRRLINIFLFLFLVINSFGFFNTGVAPGIFDISLNRPTTEEVIVINNSKEVVKVKVYSGTEKSIKENENLGQWLRVYPRMMTLKPKGERRIKFTVRIPKSAKDGEYKGILYIEEIPTVIKGTSTLTLAGRHGLTVYGFKGKENYKVDILNIEIKNQELKIDIKNNSNKSIKPKVKLNYLNYLGKSLKKDEITCGRIGKDAQIQLTRMLEETLGEVLEIELTVKGQQLYKRNIKLK